MQTQITEVFIPIADGWGESGKPNQRTRLAFELAANLSEREIKTGGANEVRVGLIKSVVQNDLGQIWWLTLYALARELGIQPENITIAEKKTTGSISDAEAITEIAKAYPDAKITIIFTAGGIVKKALLNNYRLVARHRCNYRLSVSAINIEGIPVPFENKVKYALIWLFGSLFGLTRPSALWWFEFYERHTLQRKSGFTSTIS